MLPTAIPSEVATDPAVVRFTKKAPTTIAGQTSYPASSRVASAMPVGAHTGVALGLEKASCSPSFPATKYAAAMATSSQRRLYIARSPRAGRAPG